MALSQPTDPVPQDGEKVSDNNDEDKIVEKARKRRKRIFNEIREQVSEKRESFRISDVIHVCPHRLFLPSFRWSSTSAILISGTVNT